MEVMLFPRATFFMGIFLIFLSGSESIYLPTQPHQIASIFNAVFWFFSGRFPYGASLFKICIKSDPFSDQARRGGTARRAMK